MDRGNTETAIKERPFIHPQNIQKIQPIIIHQYHLTRLSN